MFLFPTVSQFAVVSLEPFSAKTYVEINWIVESIHVFKFAIQESASHVHLQFNKVGGPRPYHSQTIINWLHGRLLTTSYLGIGHCSSGLGQS